MSTHHRRQAIGPAQESGRRCGTPGGLRVQGRPPARVEQIFKEVWRQERDFFFEKSMNGVLDWEAVRTNSRAGP